MNHFDYRGPFTGIYRLTLIPAWIANYIHYDVCNETTYPFQISTVGAFKNEKVISSHILLGLWLHIHAVIKVKPCV